MKAKMKKLISIKSMPVLALALLVVLGTALAESEGDTVTGSGSVTATQVGTFEGTATLSIEGEKFGGSVTVTPLAAPKPKDGGLYFPVVEHLFDFGDDNTLTTIGAEFAKPTDQLGLSILSGDMNITGGTGDFLEASGEMNVHGQIHLIEGWASFKVNGTICR
ncbi:MAG: hypothetical protein ACYSUD_05755 [Planctomycetota bacterium]